jgi:hypothetical protein
MFSFNQLFCPHDLAATQKGSMSHSKLQLVIMGFCLVAIFWIATPSNAEATPAWMTTPPEFAEVTGKAEEPLLLLTEILGIATKVSCETLALDKALLESEGKSSGIALFGGCRGSINGEENALCKPHTEGTTAGTVATNALKAQLVMHEGAPLVRVQPVTGETFVTLKMEAGCPIGTKVPVIGAFFAKDSNGKLESEEVGHVFAEGPLTEIGRSPKRWNTKRRSTGVRA